MQAVVDDMGEHADLGYTRSSATLEHVVLNGADALMLDTTLEAIDGGGSPSPRKSIYLVLFDKGIAVGQVHGLFEDGAYEKSAEQYDDMFATVRLDGARA